MGVNAPLSDPIGYLAACYRADNRNTSISDLFHRDIRHRYFATGTEVLLTGLQTGLAVPAELGSDAMKAVATYTRERRLIYGAFFVTGTTTASNGATRKLCAPVVLFPAKLRRDGELFYLETDPQEQRANFSLFAELIGDQDGSSEVVEKLLRRIPEPPFDALAISELMSIFQDFIPDVNVDALYGFPELVDERAVKRVPHGLACIPAAAMALIPNPPAARGAVFELAQEEMCENFSAPVATVFGQTTSPRPGHDEAAPAVPAELSHAQQKIVHSARHHPLTLVVGPPGTGKSFTAAAVAIDHVARGESVLICCRTDGALDVIEEKLETMLGDDTAVLRGGSRDTRRELKSYLEGLLSGRLDTSLEDENGPLESKLRKSQRAVAETERQLTSRTDLEHRFCELDGKRDQLGVIGRMKHAWLDWRVRNAPPHWEHQRQLVREQTERIRLTSDALHRARKAQLRRVLDEHRSDLKSFVAALRARTSSRQERMFERTEMAPILSAFPIWMSTFRDLYRLAPFTRELFDLVIVDEATQSDMASPLPAFQRARRAVVTGDPRQLRHVSFLSRRHQQRFAEAHGLDDALAAKLDFREKSLLDLVDDALGSQEQVGFLNEHFRSKPSIIAFSNREFYGGALHVMTERPDIEHERAVELRRLEGSRDARGVNRKEATAVVDELERQLGDARVPAGVPSRSIGILSPFRDQVEHLREMVMARLDVEAIERHDILIATAYGFQGQERDLMLLSLTVDEGSHPMSFRYLNQEDVFNVSVTRARDSQIVFTTLPDGMELGDSVLGRYLRQLERAGSPLATTSTEAQDAFVAAVAHKLRFAGFDVWTHYPVAGTEIDLVVSKDGATFGIDVIGLSGGVGGAVAVERTRMLARAGLTLFPLPLSAWSRDAARCVDAIEQHRQSVALTQNRH